MNHQEILSNLIGTSNVDEDLIKKIIDICDRHFLENPESSRKRTNAINTLIKNLSKEEFENQ